MPKAADDNFVRRNLKRRNPRFKYKQSRRRLADSSADCGAFDPNEPEVPSSSGNGGKEDRYSTGVANWGLDPLELSLNRIQSAPAAKARKPAHPALPEQPFIRGLSLDVKKASKPLDMVFDAMWSKHADQQVIAQLEALAPTCSGHQMAARLYTVRKAGPNRTRRFYSCCFPADQRCGYFLWAEDNPELMDANLQANDNDMASSPVSFAMSVFGFKLSQLSKDGLVAELQRFKARRAANRSAPEAPLKVSGSRPELEQRLMQEARWWVEQSRIRYPALFLCQQHRDASEGAEVPMPAVAAAPAPAVIVPAAPVLKREDGDEEEEEDVIYLSDSSEEDDEEEPAPPADAASDGDDGDDDESNGEEGDMVELSDSEDSAQAPEDSAVDKVVRWFFGFAAIRPAQRTVIERILKGQSTLAVLPTGYGKSLCYMAPACALPGITLVISPLVSLIKDQAFKLPPDLVHITLSGSMGSAAYRKLVDAALRGLVKVIFVSPERFCSRAFLQFIDRLQARYGQQQRSTSTSTSSAVSLLCIDEAHCLSQWAHLFRASYLLLPRLLPRIAPTAVLALTATASAAVQRDICSALGIDEGRGRVTDRSVRSNISLSCERMDHDQHDCDDGRGIGQSRREQVRRCLTHGAPEGVLQGNSIVYVPRRRDCADLLEHLSTVHSIGGVQAYHAGMQSQDRDAVLQSFQQAKPKGFQCIIATVAFGMGVDKGDVHTVLHCALPRSIEAYLQEIGRAGRSPDTQAQAVLLYSARDAATHACLAHSSSVCLLQLTGLIAHFLGGAGSSDGEQVVRACVVEQAERLFDASTALVETVACLLQQKGLLRLHSLSEFEEVQVTWRITPEGVQALARGSGSTSSGEQDQVLRALAQHSLVGGAKGCTLTRTALSTSSGVCRYALPAHLFALQRTAVLHYCMRASAVVYTPLPHPAGGAGSDDVILRTAEEVHAQLLLLVARDEQRAISMFRLAATAEEVLAEAGQGGAQVCSEEVQRFAAYLLDHTPEEAQHTPDEALAAALGLSATTLLHLLAAYRRTPSPYCPLDTEVRSRIRDGVRLLAADRDLLALCRHLAAAPAADRIRDPSLRRDMLAHYLSRVLLGLASPLLRAYTPRTRGAAVPWHGDSDEEEEDGGEQGRDKGITLCVDSSAVLREHFGQLQGRLAFADLLPLVRQALDDIFK